MSVARNIIKNPKLVPGGGATELTVSAMLKQKSSSIEGIEKVNYVLQPLATFIMKSIHEYSVYNDALWKLKRLK